MVIVMPSGSPAITEATIEANGLTFATLTMGDGPLALCLHGFPDSAWTWRHLLPKLAAAGYRAVAPFLRGYAPTSIPADGMYQIGAHASDANALHQALGGGPDAVLIGHDVGALAAYPAAVAAPERWSKVVTLAIPPPARMVANFFQYDQMKRSWYIFMFQTPLAELAVPADDFAFIDRIWADWSPGFDGSEWTARARAALGGPANLRAGLAMYRAMAGSGLRSPAFDSLEAAGTQPLTQPVLYLHGTTDGCFPVDEMDATVTDAMPNPASRAELIDGVGHFLHLEQPASVNARIIEFLTA